MPDLLSALDRFCGWFHDAALPRWTKAGWDRDDGGFFEALDFNGEPVRGMRRVRVQSRQVYTFSMVGLRNWHEAAEPLAAKGFEYLIERACPDQGARGCVHRLANNGAVIDDRRDLYDQAFLLLACAGRIEATNCAEAYRLARRVMAFLDAELSSPHGGWRESDKGETPRRQNPHMHLHEAFMALFRATGDDQWRRRAAETAALFQERFFDAERRVLVEFFNADLKSPDDERGDIVEPGHMMEWVWLFNRHALMTGADLTKMRAALYRAAQGYAERGAGFLPDSVGSTAMSGARRLWPQTEYVKAALTLSEALHDDYAKDAARLLEACFKSYLKTDVSGLWRDRFDRNGSLIARDVPASILYHLFEAVEEAMRYKKRTAKS